MMTAPLPDSPPFALTPSEQGHQHASTRYRPERLSEVRGHDSIKKVVTILVDSARVRRGVLPHMLFSGPPGLGKTTIALALSHEMNAELIHVQGDGLPVASLRQLLQEIPTGALLFIDEIHRLQGPACELLYGPLEDAHVIIKGEVISLPPFTAVAATTNMGRMPAPLRKRFRHVFRLDFLGIDELAVAAWYAAAACRVRISKKGCVELAKRSKGTPRRAVQLVEWVADCALASGIGAVAELTVKEVDDALLHLGIGREGFDETDRRYLNALAAQFQGGPVGIKALSSVLGDEPETLEREVEPWLVRMGYVILTPRGRCVGPGPS